MLVTHSYIPSNGDLLYNCQEKTKMRDTRVWAESKREATRIRSQASDQRCLARRSFGSKKNECDMDVEVIMMIERKEDYRSLEDC